MRTTDRLLTRVLSVLVLAVFSIDTSFAQGRVVINEYMPWTPSACNASADFVELLNFGPGPVNIGCYVLTDGDYAITIPANTILQPGEFYVLSGQDIVTVPCANIDSTIHIDLNWSSCNCTSGTIPATGDGFLTDGGSANEQLVLFDASMNIIDAVARSLPVETSSQILTSTAGGACTSQEFDLDMLTINYETIGESAGRGNSFARRLDGDCGWVKDPQQSGNATNNTPGDVSDVSYNFFYTQSRACPDNGSIAVTVQAANYGSVFPMSYTLAFDTDGDGIFETTDSYTNGTVTNPNTIAISNLVPGTYRLTVASVKGCYLHTFPFVILDCSQPLPVKLTAFTVKQQYTAFACNWTVEGAEDLETISIERSADGLLFSSFATIAAPPGITGTWNTTYRFTEDNTTQPYFRLRIRSKAGVETFSSIVNTGAREATALLIWPNPAKSQVNIATSFSLPGNADLVITTTNNHQVMKKNILVPAGHSQFSLPVDHLAPGVYLLSIHPANRNEPVQRIHFVKL